MCQRAVSRRDFFQRMALGSKVRASILDLDSYDAYEATPSKTP
jgi:hypothetical protein